MIKSKRFNMSIQNVENIIELQNQRLQTAKKLSKSSCENEKAALKEKINDTKEQIEKLNTKDPEAAKRLKALLRDLPNAPTSCCCMGHGHHHH